jgi:hypothetical protein
MGKDVVNEFQWILLSQINVHADRRSLLVSFYFGFQIRILSSLGNFFNHSQSFSSDLGLQCSFLDFNEVSAFILSSLKHLVLTCDVLLVEIIIFEVSVLIQLIQNGFKLIIVLLRVLQECLLLTFD